MSKKKDKFSSKEEKKIISEKEHKLSNKEYEQELYKLQAELCKLQEWVKQTGQKIIIVFEGRDAAGKGGVIKRILERVSPRVFRIKRAFNILCQPSMRLTRFACWPRKKSVEPALSEQNPQSFYAA